MCDPFMVRMFLATFKRPVLGWSYDLTRWDNSAKDLVPSWGPLRVDLSHMKFADDLNKIVLADAGSSFGEFLPVVGCSVGRVCLMRGCGGRVGRGGE